MIRLCKEILWEIDPVFFFRRPFSLALNVREVIGFLNPSICLWLSVGVVSQVKSHPKSTVLDVLHIAKFLNSGTYFVPTFSAMLYTEKIP